MKNILSPATVKSIPFIWLLLFGLLLTASSCRKEKVVIPDCRSLLPGMYLMKGTSVNEKGEMRSEIMKFVKQ